MLFAISLFLALAVAGSAEARAANVTRKIGAGNEVTCDTIAGVVHCWGGSNDGILGISWSYGLGGNPGDMSNVHLLDFNPTHPVTDLAVGDRHACVLINSEVRCWGRNGSGQLGQGNKDDVGTRTGQLAYLDPVKWASSPIKAKAIAAGGSTTCAVTTTHRGYCWGSNDRGQLARPYPDSEVWSIGGRSGQMTGPAIGGWWTDTRLEDIAVGDNHMCMLLLDGRVACVGDNEYGQLGAGISAASVGRGMLDMMGLNFVNLTSIANANITQVETGAGFTCAVLQTQEAVCWGKNDHGQLGRGDTVAIGRNHTDMASLLPIDFGTSDGVTQLSIGGDVVCALFTSADVRCWGSFQNGQLGTDRVGDIGTQPGQMQSLEPLQFSSTSTVVQLAGGGTHFCAAFADTSVTCWGEGRFGPLGNENSKTVERTDTALPALLPTCGQGTANTTSRDRTYFECDQKEHCVDCRWEAEYTPPPRCGNGRVEKAEEVCDDGNLFSGDGCSPYCVNEPGYRCHSSPSVCSCEISSICGEPEPDPKPDDDDDDDDHHGSSSSSKHSSDTEDLAVIGAVALFIVVSVAVLFLKCMVRENRRRRRSRRRWYRDDTEQQGDDGGAGAMDRAAVVATRTPPATAAMSGVAPPFVAQPRGPGNASAPTLFEPAPSKHHYVKMSE